MHNNHDNKLVLIMEYIKGGSLKDHLQTKGPLTEAEAKTVFNQLIRVISYCHHQGIVHRDIKPDNILLVDKHSYEKIKIIDFGISYAWSKDDTSQHKEGTLFYCPPEMLKKNEKDRDYTSSPKSDIWSLGITLFRLVFNKMPFEGETKQEVIDAIL